MCKNRFLRRRRLTNFLATSHRGIRISRAGLSTRRASRTTRSVKNWDDYLLQTLGAESADEVAFAHAMVELDKLLGIFRDRNLALPSLGFERIWFLHYLRGSERMVQTRAVLGMLTAELVPCTSA